ncbi:MAG: hypothetical protein M1833_002392 [Piccolia ochrophora]|nr:MAG: hypothetical protein M1833_002392 [Piccolia ochrophora]
MTSALRRAADRWVAGYNAWTIPSITSHRASTCVHHMLPHSLGMPALDNEAYAGYLAGTLDNLWDVKFSVAEVMEDEAAHKPVGGEGEGELEIDEVWEFLDSGYTPAFMRKLKESKEGKGE